MYRDPNSDRGLDNSDPAVSNQLIANAERRPIKQLHQTIWNFEPRGKAGTRHCRHQENVKHHPAQTDRSDRVIVPRIINKDEKILGSVSSAGKKG